MEGIYLIFMNQVKLHGRKLDGKMSKGDKTTHVGFPFEKIAQWQVHFSMRPRGRGVGVGRRRSFLIYLISDACDCNRENSTCYLNCIITLPF